MSYTIVPLQIDVHREALLKLWRENTHDPRRNDGARERFAWLHESAVGLAQTWVAVETGSEAVIGCSAIFRCNRYVNGQMVGAGIMPFFAVDARHRTAAAALAIQRALTTGARQAGVQLIVAKVGNKKPPLFQRVGYRQIGIVQGWWKWITSDQASASEPISSSIREQIVCAADERFDRLWEQGKQRYGIVGEKTAAFLNWRYTGFPENYRYYCLLSPSDGTLTGYVVFYLVEDGVGVAELFCVDPDGPVLDRLVAGFIDRMRREGRAWISLSYLGCSSLEECLSRNGFARGTSRRDQTVLVAHVDPALPPQLADAMGQSDHWFFFGGETSVLMSPASWPDRQESIDQEPVSAPEVSV